MEVVIRGTGYGLWVKGNKMIKDYRDLQVWQKGIELVKEIYFITTRFPKSELFGLSNQMRRSAVSIPSNIAEGWMRQHTKEYVQFVYHSLGSCGELNTQVIIANNLGYINDKANKKLSEYINHIIRMLRNLIKGLQK